MVDLLIIGQVGMMIMNGIVKDGNNYQWVFLVVVMILLIGEIMVIVMCMMIGVIVVFVGMIDQIGMLMCGWQIVLNLVDVVVGVLVEKDLVFCQCQFVLIVFLFQIVFDGIVGVVVNFLGVVKYVVYENDMLFIDVNGLLLYLIVLVVEGGDVLLIVNVIVVKKIFGSGIDGIISIVVVSSKGILVMINFYCLIDVGINVVVMIGVLFGYMNFIGQVMQ